VPPPPSVDGSAAVTDLRPHLNRAVQVLGDRQDVVTAAEIAHELVPVDAVDNGAHGLVERARDAIDRVVDGVRDAIDRVVDGVRDAFTESEIGSADAAPAPVIAIAAIPTPRTVPATALFMDSPFRGSWSRADPCSKSLRVTSERRQALRPETRHAFSWGCVVMVDEAGSPRVPVAALVRRYR